MSASLPFPLRRDDKPRAVYPAGLRDLPLVELAARIKVAVLLAHIEDEPMEVHIDGYVDGRKSERAES